MTTIRFFAAARAAVGVPSVSVSGAAGASGTAGASDAASGAASGAVTLGAALAGIPDVVDPGRWAALQERCSYLVDGVTTRDRGISLAGVELVDVMPPFAGG